MLLVINRGEDYKSVKRAANYAGIKDYRIADSETLPVLKDIPAPEGISCVLVTGDKSFTDMRKQGQLSGGNFTIGRKKRHWVDFKDKKLPCLVSHNPASFNYLYSNFIELVGDIRVVVRSGATGKHEPDLPAYQYITNYEFILKRLEAGEKFAAAVDLETEGDLYSKDSHIEAVQLATKPREGFVCRRPHCNSDENIATLKAILEHPNIRIRGAGFKYDFNWLLLKWGINCQNTYKMDTLLVGSLLDENRFNSLSSHAKLYTDIGNYDWDMNHNHNKSNISIVPDDEFLVYSGGDVDSCYRVSQSLLAELKKYPRLTNFYLKLVQPAAMSFAALERTGVEVDVAYLEQLKDQLTTEMDKISADGLKLIPYKLRMMHKAAGKDLKLTNTILISNYLFGDHGLGLTPKLMTPSGKAPSTSKDHLQMFEKDKRAGPFIEKVKEYRKVQKTISTFITGFIKYVKEDGKFHPVAMQHRGDDSGDTEGGTVSGRQSYKGPAIQTLPKHTKHAYALRKAYVAPANHVIVAADYSQGELRIAADIADEPAMLKAYNEGKDLHLIAGCNIVGIDPDNIPSNISPAQLKIIRQKGKAVNFGLIYGMSAEGLQSYAYYNYGVSMSTKEAVNARNTYFATNSKLAGWHETYKNLASTSMKVESPLGRVRHLPQIESNSNAEVAKAKRQAINSPVQAALSDLTTLAMVLFHKKYGYEGECKVFRNTHDENAFYSPRETAILWASRIKYIMENLPFEDFGWHPKVKFVADVEIGDNLAEMSPVTDLIDVSSEFN